MKKLGFAEKEGGCIILSRGKQREKNLAHNLGEVIKVVRDIKQKGR